MNARPQHPFTSALALVTAAYVVAVVMGAINIRVLFRLVSGRITESELLQVVEAEGRADVEASLRGARP